MNSFIYYIPKRKSIERDDPCLESLGLSHLRGMNPASQEQYKGTPDGGPGVMFTDSRNTTALFARDKITWEKAINGLYWIGYIELPKSEDLERPGLYDYREITVDGDVWKMACGWALPMPYGIKDGVRVKVKKREFYPFYTACNAMYEAMAGGDKEWEPLIPHFVTAWGMNHFVGEMELLILQVLSNPVMASVSLLILDYDQLQKIKNGLADAQKKSEDISTPDTSGQNSGSKDEIQITS